MRIAGSTHSAADRALVDEVEESQPAFLPIETAVGQMARLVPAHSLTSGSWRRVTARAPHSYELLAIAGPIGTVALGGGNDLARVQCENGEWRLRKRRRLGLELLIEAADGRQAGLYSGRQWLGGGTISLTDESEFELRRVPPRGWRLRGMDPELLVDFRAPAGPGHRVTVTIRALAQDSVGAQLALLTACAVLTLEWTLSGASLGGG